MDNAPIIEQLSKPGDFYGTVSAERAAELESDVFITYAEKAHRPRDLHRGPAARPDPRHQERARRSRRPTRPTASGCLVAVAARDPIRDGRTSSRQIAEAVAGE